MKSMENTPYYFYDLDVLDATLEAIQSNIIGESFYVHYAIKANNNMEILKRIAKNKIGADCVSGWEIETAIEAGFAPQSIVFAGVGKTDEEIIIALTHKIGMINCESLEEIHVINQLAKQLNVCPKIALRLNPNVNALTHEKISTGLAENKFGLTVLEFKALLNDLSELNSIDITGLHFHIGSQITTMDVFANLCERILEIIPEFEQKIGPLTSLNVGGGLGIDYDQPDLNAIPDFQGYFNTFKKGLASLVNIPVHFELGRSIVAQCGSLRTKVLYVKRSENKNFAVMDAGMTELMRPALYGSVHKIEKLNADPVDVAQFYDVVGPICESSDCFGKDIRLPELHRGDIVTIRSCGAYAESMSLRYNGREAIGNNLKPKVSTSLRMLKYA